MQFPPDHWDYYLDRYNVRTGLLESRKYKRNEKVHRPGFEPADIEFHDDGSVKAYWCKLHGQRHRDDGLPAFEAFYKDGSLRYQVWFHLNELHRDGGLPAVIHFNRDGSIRRTQYHFHGFEYDIKQETTATA